MQDLWRVIIQELHLIELENACWEDIHMGIPGNSLRIKGCNTIIFMTKQLLHSARSEGAVPPLHELQKHFQ